MKPIRNTVMALLAIAAAPALADAYRHEGPSESRLMTVSLRTSDLARSLKFYTGALGMVERGRLELPTVTEVFLGFSADMQAPGIMLIVPKGPDAAAPISQGGGYVRTVIRVASARAAVDRIAAAGYAPERTGSHAGSTGAYQIVLVRDPDGYLYELVEYPREVTK